MDTRAGGRFSDERQPRDNHQQNNKFLHSNVFDGNVDKFDQTDCVLEHTTGFLGYCKRRKTALRAEMTRMRTKASTLDPFMDRNWIGRGEFIEMFATD
jgi:hypothetical protein